MKPKKRTLISDKRTGDKLNDRLLTLGEVSQLCQCSERKIRVWIKEGRLAHVAMGDGKSVASMIQGPGERSKQILGSERKESVTMIIKALDGRIIIEGDFASACAAIQAAIESKANLHGANLHRANLREADLRGADLRGADLYEADLRGANLIGANLREAILTGAILREADLREANLSKADLRGANLSEANLIEADLWEANLIGANLRGAYLWEANLWGANLSGANLREANLSKANLYGAILRGANLHEANLWGANLREANLYGAILREADLREANLSKADLRGANLSEANLIEADLWEANLIGANLRGAYLRGADLRGADLCGADLCGAILRGADLREADLRGANLREVKDLDLSIFKICPEEGSFIGWKKLSYGVIAKLEILERRVNATWSRKCRAESVKVLALFGQGDPVEGVGLYNSAFVYRVGETVRADSFDDSPFIECSHGIHFYITRQEAEDHV